MKKCLLARAIFSMLYIPIKSSADIVGAVLQLHRQNGTKRGSVWAGHPCQCTYCFGICPGAAIDDGTDNNMAVNTVFQDLGNGTIRLYILQEPDDDVTIDPTMYVDNDVLLSGATLNMTIAAGQYQFCTQQGMIAYKGKQYLYYGTAIVTIK